MRLYLTALADLFILGISLMADIDPVLRTAGLLVGVLVGVLTFLKMLQALKTGATERKLKKLELQKKEEEIRRYFQEKHDN